MGQNNVTHWCCSGGGCGGCLIHATLIAGSTDWSREVVFQLFLCFTSKIFNPPVSAVGLVSVIAAIVAKIKKHVSPTGIVLSYSSIAMPKLPGKEIVISRTHFTYQELTNLQL